jgi:hypothetical protein
VAERPGGRDDGGGAVMRWWGRRWNRGRRGVGTAEVEEVEVASRLREKQSDTLQWEDILCSHRVRFFRAPTLKIYVKKFIKNLIKNISR